ncbi:MAG: hypothetical protein DIZ77_00720 [endosymbiont of Seepiophila jonesi]|uniref:Pentapeptide MXKDX repeat protein n=1 Tax=endosymbiont of Lamellibrachia luymesi TaxID=2200907 RepID=A0A370DFJ2_9GAMM|nr:MAG: hypothetical protein DIZ79_17400 [endosymbiont of Lamellibrachia luymesi]RDH94527.1 MAG: hypothetical protein DIZ77_00720 [endosymbiont of Seepiophila jonesi]
MKTQFSSTLKSLTFVALAAVMTASSAAPMMNDDMPMQKDGMMKMADDDTMQKDMKMSDGMHGKMEHSMEPMKKMNDGMMKESMDK